MQSERIYSAPSLREVAQQLLIYRPTGVLTLWRAAASRQDDIRITVEQGRLLHVFWGVAYQENLSETTLEWLNNWGEIHFSFLSTESRLRLPSPSQHTTQPQQSVQPSFPSPPNNMQQFQHRTAEVHPLVALSPRNRSASSITSKIGAVQGNSSSTSQIAQNPQIQESRQAYTTHPDSTAPRSGERQVAIPIIPEAVVASLTNSGQNYPIANLARYERTIFLLINGRRSMVDLSQLTKRTLDEIYGTLNRLEQMQLITINTVPKAGYRPGAGGNP